MARRQLPARVAGRYPLGLVASEGLSGVEASILHNAWLGYEPDWIPVSRGTSPEDLNSGWESLRRRGLANGDKVTDEGVALRQKIEDRTDSLNEVVWRSLGRDRDGSIRGAIRAWLRACSSTGSTSPQGRTTNPPPGYIESERSLRRSRSTDSGHRRSDVGRPDHPRDGPRGGAGRKHGLLGRRLQDDGPLVGTDRGGEVFHISIRRQPLRSEPRSDLNRSTTGDTPKRSRQKATSTESTSLRHLRSRTTTTGGQRSTT